MTHHHNCAFAANYVEVKPQGSSPAADLLVVTVTHDNCLFKMHPVYAPQARVKISQQLNVVNNTKLHPMNGQLQAAKCGQQYQIASHEWTITSK